MDGRVPEQVFGHDQATLGVILSDGQGAAERDEGAAKLIYVECFLSKIKFEKLEMNSSK